VVTGSEGSAQTVCSIERVNRHVDFEEEIVVFNDLSWDVHVLNPAASLVYELLLESPRSLQELGSLLGEVLPDDQKEAAAAHVQRLVSDLVSLGLVRTDPPLADATQRSQ
jgi:PqqD family protein of HPr-rel-A system